MNEGDGRNITERETAGQYEGREEGLNVASELYGCFGPGVMYW